MNSVIRWSQVHTFWFAIILFVLSALISIYSQEVRQFVHSWPRTRRMGRAFSRNSAQNRLDLLRVLHNNSYQLSLYVFSSIAGVVLAAILWNLIILVLLLITTRRMPTTLSFWSIAMGIFLGKLMEMSTVFADLYRYDEAVRKLEAKLTRYFAGQKVERAEVSSQE